MTGPRAATESIQMPLSQISERLGHLRIIHPKGEKAMLRSMEKYGQITPVVVSQMETNRHELLDGFKRLRAAKALSFPSLTVRVLNLGIRAGKAAMMQLNWIGKSISSLEEALVVHSLHHEDGLTQVEIATLLGRHKSWVCRRVSLIDRLSEEVKEDIKLGLLPVSLGVELAQLQRSNQMAVLETIRKHHLTWRDTRKLVTAIKTRPRHDMECILRNPWTVLESEGPFVTTEHRISDPLARELHRKLVVMESHCRNAAFAIGTSELGQFSVEEEALLISCCKQALESMTQTKKCLLQTVEAYDPIHQEP